ncbi:hypothetical protein IJS77_04700 [bacterium]|nr:hypothetical protein [bacterium]
MGEIELKYAPRKCKYFCCGDCGISGRTCISDYPECRAAEEKDKPFTNYQKIKNNTIDEMIAFIRKTTCKDICENYEHFNGECNCNAGIKAWLMKEYKGME